MGQDHIGGTAAAAANSQGWGLPMSGKTGTTEAHRSSAFLGFTNQLAGAAYVYNDGPNPSGHLHQPLRQCYDGDLWRHGTGPHLVPGDGPDRDQVRSGPVGHAGSAVHGR